jgi:DNA replication and repair protein RecF
LVAITRVAEQTFITAAVESDLPEELLTERFYVSPGSVTKTKAPE